MKLVNLYTVKQMILAERDKIRLTVPAASYELVKENQIYTVTQCVAV